MYFSGSGEQASSEETIKKKLPRVLKLQLDNCAGDNKNKYVFAYLSLLTAREVFEEVHLGFLMVGHTHEDVDAMFGHFSERLMHHPAYTLPDLMALLMKARKPNPIPHFVQEVPDFKSYLEPFLLSGRDTLVGHLKPRLFKFYVRSDGMPCFQYKLRSMDDAWLPENGIQMWSRGSDGMPSLPSGNPKRLPMVEMKALDDVKLGLRKYLNFINKVAGKKEGTQQNWKGCADYWTRILDTIESQVTQYRPHEMESLQNGFWPVSKWRDHVPNEYRKFACELEKPLHYVGPQRHKPKDTFQPRLHIVENNFIFVRPATEDLPFYPVWMGKVVSNVYEGDVNEEGNVEHMCKVQWYRPYMEKKRGQPECSRQDRWRDCWSKKWEKDSGYDIEAQSINTVLWSFKPRRTPNSYFVTISKTNKEKALDNLQRCIETDLRSCHDVEEDDVII